MELKVRWREYFIEMPDEKVLGYNFDSQTTVREALAIILFNDPGIFASKMVTNLHKELIQTPRDFVMKLKGEAVLDFDSSLWECQVSYPFSFFLFILSVPIHYGSKKRSTSGDFLWTFSSSHSGSRLLCWSCR